MLRRLAVFAGGCSLDAAGAICAGDDVAADDVPDVVVRLVDRSLVVPDRRDDEARIRLLETIREYAGELLVAAGEAEATRALATELLARSRPKGDRYGTLAALRTLAVTAGEREGECDTAISLTRESLAVCRELGECWETAHQLFVMAVGRNRSCEYRVARAYFEEGLAILRKLGDRHLATLALSQLGAAARRQGDDRAAEALLTEAVAGLRTWRDYTSTGFCLAELAAIARARGDFATARARLAESLRLYWEAGDRPAASRLLHRLAGLAVAEGRLERGARLFGAAEAFRDALGVAWILPAERAEYEDDVGAARRLLDDAVFERFWSEGRALPPEQAIADALDSG